MFLLLRFCCAALSAYIFSLYMPNPAHLLYRLSPYWDCWGEYCKAQWYWYDDLAFNIRIVTIALWLLSWALLEIRSFKRFPLRAPKLLTHLRYGPIVTLFFFFVAVLATNLALIQYSRWKIISYIHSDAPVTEYASFKLHNPYRGSCGNGWSATEYYLYGDTAASYIDDPDPAIRARSLLASIAVYDGLNQPSDGPATDALKKSLADSDPVVRGIAEKYKGHLLPLDTP